jgi:hypothetical protein
LVLALKYTCLDIQLYDDAVPKSELNGQDATTQWKQGETGTKQVITATVPETMYNQIKGSTCKEATC